MGPGETKGSDHPFGRVASRHPVRIGAPGDGAMGDVFHHHFGILGQRDRFGGQVVTIEQDPMASQPVERGHLVENPGGHPGSSLLCSLAEQCDI